MKLSEKEKTQKLLDKLGFKKLKKKDKYKIPFPNLRVESSYNLSNEVSNGFKKSIDDYKWKKDKEESFQTIEEIERKKKRIAPAYSKGAMQYITDDAENIKTLGRKI
jgi:hypothetical protein